jgi:hypothetical protein|tara:strand:+ start:636 stop:1040 length:405 start_codon:yes stop_codon:yes gene_type:complete
MGLYKPLHQGLTIKQSDIEGLGLFSEINMGPGIDLGPSHIDTGVKAYGIEGNLITRTPLGGYYNHSDTPNCEKLICNSECVYKNTHHWHLHTIKAIKSGDELTATYSMYDIPEPVSFDEHEEPYRSFNTDEGIE